MVSQNTHPVGIDIDCDDRLSGLQRLLQQHIPLDGPDVDTDLLHVGVLADKSPLALLRDRRFRGAKNAPDLLDAVP